MRHLAPIPIAGARAIARPQPATTSVPLGLLSLAAIGFGANALVTFARWPVPGNAVAIVAAFALVRAGVVPERAVSAAASFLVRHLSLFFAPLVVGIAWSAAGIGPAAGPLAAAAAISSACGIAAAGLTARRWAARP